MTKQSVWPTTVKEMVGLAFGSRPELLPELERKFEDFEKQLEGKKGEFVLIEYTASVPFKHTMTHTESRSEEFFRLGVLGGEKLIWAELNHVNSITLEVPQYLYDFSKPVVKSNIFAQHSEPLDARLPLLGYHIADISEIHPSLIGMGRASRVNNLLIGDEAVKKWLRVHYFVRSQGEKYFKKAAALLSKLILEPMGPNEGPLPAGAWDDLCQVPDP